MRVRSRKSHAVGSCTQAASRQICDIKTLQAPGPQLVVDTRSSIHPKEAFTSEMSGWARFPHSYQPFPWIPMHMHAQMQRRGCTHASTRIHMRTQRDLYTWWKEGCHMDESLYVKTKHNNSNNNNLVPDSKNGSQGLHSPTPRSKLVQACSQLTRSHSRFHNSTLCAS